MNDQPLSDRLRGVHAATVCPLDGTGAVDVAALCRHIGAVTGVTEIKGLLLNGHAGEGPLLTAPEKALVIESARTASPAGTFLCAGVTSEATAAACVEATAAGRAGADAVLVFPPAHFALGHDRAMALDHHQAVAATGLPMLIYRAPLAAGHLAYGLDTLAALSQIPAVVGVKEGSWEVAAYEEVRRTVKAHRPDMAVLASGDEHLMTGYLIGTEGSQVSLAALISDAIVAMFAAAQAGDWAAARHWHEVIYPLSAAIYRTPPAYRATARLKVALVLCGALSSDRVKRPMQPATAEDRARLKRALSHVEEHS